MSDTYQAVYDAVRTQLRNCDVGDAIRSAMSSFDISYIIPPIVDNINWAVGQYARPSAVYRPTLTLDGNQWCALYGTNLQEGCTGFGESPEAAMYDFDRNWEKSHNSTASLQSPR